MEDDGQSAHRDLRLRDPQWSKRTAFEQLLKGRVQLL